MTELRRRHEPIPIAVTSTTSTDPSTSLLPPSPSLERTNTNSSTEGTASGTQTPSLITTGKYNDSDLFSGLGLLDILNSVDAHIELWSKGIRKTSLEWKEKADLLVEDGRKRAEKLQRQALPRLKSEVNLFSFGLGGEGNRDVLLTAKDKERLEKKYREVRARTTESLKKLSQKWEEEKTVRLRDKISFFYGVHNVLVSAILLGFYPTWIPFYYTVQVLAYLPLRVYSYKKKSFHYFLFDACYYVNLLCLVYIWILPSNPYLFEACYGLSLGTLGTAIATWRNSLVFHDLDKVISLVIHIFPPFVMTTIRHYYPSANLRYPALDVLPVLRPWRSIGISMTAYLIWQLGYYRWVIVARKAKIEAGRATSFTYLINDKKRLIGKIAAKVPEGWRESAFMLGQAIYTFITLLIPVFVLYDSKFWSTIYLVALFSISTWNGGSFYMDVFARKFEKELVALRREFEEQQVQLNKSLNAVKSIPSIDSDPKIVGSEAEVEKGLGGGEGGVDGEDGEGEGRRKDSASSTGTSISTDGGNSSSTDDGILVEGEEEEVSNLNLNLNLGEQDKKVV